MIDELWNSFSGSAGSIFQHSKILQRDEKPHIMHHPYREVVLPLAFAGWTASVGSSQAHEQRGRTLFCESPDEDGIAILSLNDPEIPIGLPELDFGWYLRAHE